MFKHILAAMLALLISSNDSYAQHGGHGGGGHGGAVHGGGGGYRGGYGGYRGGYGGYGGYGRGFYGGYGGWGYGGLGWGYGGYGYGLGGYGYPSYGGYYYPNYGYPDAGTAIVPDTTVPYTSGYTPSSNVPADPPITPIIEAYAQTRLNGPVSSDIRPASFATTSAPAVVAVIVPKEGQVWFNDQLNPPKTGTRWVFSTENLQPGKTYVVNVKARWKDGEQDRSYNIPLRVEAGDNMTVDLTNMR